MSQKIEEKKDIENIINEVLADTIGVEQEDIQSEDSFADDLHMTPANLSDFIESLESRGFDVGKIDLTEITTVEELVESLSAQELIT